jgi:hypothetical protein
LPSTRGSAAPSTIAEGLNGIASSITMAMTAPDAAPYLQLLQGLQQAVVGAIHGGQKGPPQPGQGQGGGGGMNLGQLQGQPPQGPSAGPTGGPSMSGMSADDMRRLTAQSAAEPS